MNCPNHVYKLTPRGSSVNLYLLIPRSGSGNIKLEMIYACDSTGTIVDDGVRPLHARDMVLRYAVTRAGADRVKVIEGLVAEQLGMDDPTYTLDGAMAIARRT